MLIAISWFIAVTFAVLSGLTQNASNLWQFCTRCDNTTEHYIKTLNSIYAVVYFGGVTLVPFIAICVIYVCIYSAAHNSSERMRSTKSNHVDTYMQIETPCLLQRSLPKVQSAPNIIMLNKEERSTSVKRSFSERTGFITNLKCRISNASVFRYREETRAAKISILVIFMVLACYVPYGLAVVLNSDLVNITTPQSYNYAALVLLMLSNIISPFLFAYRNRRIRRELLRFLKIARPGDSGVNSIIPVVEVRRRRSEEVPTIKPFVAVPQVIITCKLENEKVERPSILKRVCSTKNWTSYKKCSFITVPQSCYQTDSARGSFSSASTQISTDDG
ncbi:hypothetical protein RN001_010520 [Aquatica leii]|uniref:G-protein coupled receptors family 1 profile domain-containing protein n=1 Tax=Aquatica leii TaxID=1421715 RepID=A0AAN7PUY3_9COLE|nr:hypothetical protein RN001_010520 [Aquatica leii]